MSDVTNHSVPAIERALTVLEFLGESRSGFSTSEISRRLGLPKSSTYLIVETLERQGFLRKNPQTGKYHLGLKLISLSRHALENLDLREAARPFLYALMQQTRLIVHLAVLDGTEAVVLEKVATPGMLVVPTWIGRRLDVNCTGVGKALVAYISDEQLEMIAKAKGFPRRNDNTITSLTGLKQELARVRAMGYSLDDEEDEIGERCIGAPVFNADSQIVAAISLAGTINQIPDDRIPDMANLLMQTAAQISARLGRKKKGANRASNDGNPL